jgi:hypothetical protein
MLDLPQFRLVLNSHELRVQHGLDLPSHHIDELLQNEPALTALFQQWDSQGQPRYVPAAAAAAPAAAPGATPPPPPPAVLVDAEPIENALAGIPPEVLQPIEHFVEDFNANPVVKFVERPGALTSMRAAVIVIGAAILGVVGVLLHAPAQFLIIAAVIFVVALVAMIRGLLTLRRG